MSTNKFINVASVLFLITLALASHKVYALEWENLWSTPEQRASRQLDSEQYDELVEQAPDSHWRGVGEYRKGDYAAAIDSFAQQRESSALAGSAKEVEQAMYNQANAHVLNESYQEAISLFDELLELNSDHADANHNRAVAEQLLEQQQEQEQQEQEQQSSDGEQQEGEQQEGEQSEGESGDQSGDQQQSEENESAQNDNDNAEQDAQSAEQQSQAEQDEQAASAMQAEQEANANNQNAENETTGEATQASDAQPPDPLTEKEQANEQWLRQIPDDPAGLLERKLQNRHLTDFPKVKDSVNPW